MPFDTEMQFLPFLYTGVLGLLEYESVELQCQGLASPSVRPRSLALPLALASAVSTAGLCIRHERLERRGRPMPGEPNILHRETHRNKQDQHASWIIEVRLWARGRWEGML